MLLNIARGTGRPTTDSDLAEVWVITRRKTMQELMGTCDFSSSSPLPKTESDLGNTSLGVYWRLRASASETRPSELPELMAEDNTRLRGCSGPR